MVIMGLVQWVLLIAILFITKDVFKNKDVVKIKQKWTLEEEQRETKKAIEKAIETEDMIDFKKLVKFDFSSVKVLTPPMAHTQAFDELGMNWGKLKDLSIDHFDFYHIVVFIKDHEVIQYVRIPQKYGDFTQESETVYQFFKRAEEIEEIEEIQEKNESPI